MNSVVSSLSILSIDRVRGLVDVRPAQARVNRGGEPSKHDSNYRKSVCLDPYGRFRVVSMSELLCLLLNLFEQW
jgi:hypothetical protein